MAGLRVISSGSIGNSYILECSKEKLLLELGVKFDEILSNLEYNIYDVAGCLVSHR